MSHTVDVAWYQNLEGGLQLVPFVRYYTQDEAKFFDVVADTTEEFYADDYRLSAYGAFTYGLRVRKAIGPWSVNVAGERYKSDESWSLYEG